MNCVKILFTFFILIIAANNFASAQSWQKCNPLPEAMAPVTARIGDKIYVLNTTWDLSKAGSLYEYDIKRNSWKQKSGMSVIRYGFSAVAMNGKVFAIGGIADTSGTPTSVVEEYDPVLDKWIVKSPMPTARYLMTACGFENKIYVFGGFIRGFDNDIDVLEVYDPATDKWQKKSSMPTKRSFNLISIINRNLYLFSKNGFDKYNPETDKWTSTSSHEHTNCEIVRAAMVDNEIYAIINRRGVASYLSKYNPATDSWVNLKSLFYHKMDFSFAAFGKRLYIIGGWKDNYQQAVSTCEMYDTENDSWKIIPDMSVPRVEAGTEIYNDSIFVIGGFDGYKYNKNNYLDNKRITYYANVEALTD